MLRGAVALWALLCAFEACAQVSGSFALVSDYRFRGVSLSDGRPAAQLGVAYDHADGWYAGAFASSVRFGPRAGPDAQVLSYFGYARRLRSGLSWDLGAGYAAFTGRFDYDYPEFHVGLASERLGARISYAPRYFGEDAAVVYAQVDGAHELSERLRLLGHLGWTRRDDAGATGFRWRQPRLDARIGIGLTLRGCDLQLAWVTGRGEAGRSAAAGRSDRSTWVVSVSRAW